MAWYLALALMLGPLCGLLLLVLPVAFAFFVVNVLGAIVWGAGITLLGYWLGQFSIIQKLIEPIFILIVVLSVLPMVFEWYRRRRNANAGVDESAA